MMKEINVIPNKNAICPKCGFKTYLEFKNGYFSLCTNCIHKIMKDMGVGVMEPIKEDCKCDE
jgi:hypothetical protein